MKRKKANDRGKKVFLGQLRYIVTAADCGSMRAAAKTLNVRPSTLSRSIGEFEKATSIVVFQRSREGLTPCAEGQRVIDMARSVLTQIEAATSSARS